MADQKPRTAEINGALWGARARDWAEIQEPQARPLYEAAFSRARVGTGTRYLDAGCGSGLAAQIAAERGASVSGIDASEALLAIARERVPQGDFREGELESLPFGDGSFDVAAGFNAFQFAGNPSVALAEGRRVTKPGGAVVIVTWGNPEGMEAASVLGALRSLLPPPPPGAPGPFALSDEAALRAFATEAGLKPVEVFDVDIIFSYPDEAAAIRGFNATGVAARAMRTSTEQAVSDAHAKALAPHRQRDGSVRFKGAFRGLLTRA